MSKIHVLESPSLNVFNAVVHIATPAGNNAAGVSWANAIVGAGRNVSVLTVGNGPGQNTQAESNQIASGAVIEGQFQVGIDPTMTTAEKLAALDTAATNCTNELLASFAQDLNYFGLTRN